MHFFKATNIVIVGILSMKLCSLYGFHTDSSCRFSSAVRIQDRSKAEWTWKQQKKCRPQACPTDDDSEGEISDMDRREAVFAMIGTVWAVTTTSVLGPESASATYGADAKIALPNPIESMSDRANKQCLVESLGNRECLVYMDEENKLYKGADNNVLLQRLEKASTALTTIPALAQEKKWLAIRGVLTGPMGELAATTTQLLQLTENTAAATKAAKAVKTDIFAIAAAAEKKQGDAVLKYTEAAVQDLATFVKSL